MNRLVRNEINWSAARLEPGMPRVVRMRKHTMGVPQLDGTLPAAAVASPSRSRRTSTAATIFLFEWSVARGAGARFAIERKDEHVDMTTHAA
eukprot:2107257-Pleurochrysis_carterae.AAC.1